MGSSARTSRDLTGACDPRTLQTLEFQLSDFRTQLSSQFCVPASLSIAEPSLLGPLSHTSYPPLWKIAPRPGTLPEKARNRGWAKKVLGERKELSNFRAVPRVTQPRLGGNSSTLSPVARLPNHRPTTPYLGQVKGAACALTLTHWL